MSQKFVQRLEEVDAIQWNGDGNIDPIREFIGEELPIRIKKEEDGSLYVVIENCGVEDGESYLFKNGWVINDGYDNFYTLRDEEFKIKWVPKA